jgi:hypothetical protein
MLRPCGGSAASMKSAAAAIEYRRYPNNVDGEIFSKNDSNLHDF